MVKAFLKHNIDSYKSLHKQLVGSFLGNFLMLDILYTVLPKVLAHLPTKIYELQ